MRQSLFLTVMPALVFCGSAAVNAQPDQSAGPWQTYDTSNGEWRSYAGDVGGKKYSPLDQIDASNFADLRSPGSGPRWTTSSAGLRPAAASGWPRSTPWSTR